MREAGIFGIFLSTGDIPGDETPSIVNFLPEDIVSQKSKKRRDRHYYLQKNQGAVPTFL
jgi:hypothetical protein